MLERVLRLLEGRDAKCIICGKRCAGMQICYDGVGVCTKCYNTLISKRAGDYYDTNGRVRRLFAPFEYDGDLRRAVLALKFDDATAYAKPLAKLVFDALPPYYMYDYDMLVPVPLHPNRRRERGYNQTELLADELSGLLGVPVVDDVLFRIRDTEHQMRLSRMMRENNVRGAFLTHEQSVRGKRILLVDDIYTAGATIGACSAELLGKGAAEVSAIVVCENFKYINMTADRPRIPTVKE